MKKALLLTLFFALIVTFGFSQTDRFWSANNEVRSSIITDKGVARKSFPKEFKLFNLNTESLRKELFSIVGSSAKRQTVISLPNAKGGFEEFEVNEASNFEPSLQARFPEIRAYSGRGITDRAASLKISISPQGIQTMVFRTGQANEFIEPFSKDHSVYAVFKSQRDKGQLQWTCSTPEENLAKSLNSKVASSGFTESSTGELKTIRLAQSCNGEYSNFFGAFNAGQVALVLAAYNATLTRCNGTYEKDLALHLNLVSASTNVIYYDPATDPYTTLANWNTQLQIALNTSLTGPATPIGVNNAAYDIGHMFGASGGGGNAGCIGCVCVDGQPSGTGATKGRGITSPADAIPMGDNFDIDYVAHEIGHQIGGNHTFSMGNEGTGVNKEVGSGITIMGYAGITSQDVAPHSIDIWHQASIAQIQANLATKTCPITTVITANNATPVVAPVANATIPINTPFALTGSATDANPGDVLTYCWEQNDDGTGQTGNNSVAYPTKPTGPNWLTFPATVSGTRYMPRLSTILAGLYITPTLPGGDAIANIEALSSVSRTLNYRLTVRDNAAYVADPPGSRKVGQTAFTDMTVTVTNTSGPFQVTQPNTNVSWAGGSSQTVTWDVNNTTAAPVSCANVRILLSTDGGTTFPTVLLASTPNDGTQAVTIPNGPSTTARIKVEAVGNIFFDISNTNFTITGVVATNPTVTINQAVAQPDPTGASPILFTAVFDQTVTGFATGDVTLSGTAGANSAIVSGGPTTYTVTVSGMTGSGTVIATIPAGVCINGLSEPNLASTSTDNTVTYNAPPVCTAVNPVPNQTVCNGAPTTAVNFTSPVAGTTFSWVNNTTSIGLAASGNGNIASFTATNATALPVTATITVTPTLTTVTATTTTFNFTGGAQTFTVPAGVSSINITTLGAQGGAGATGGNGATGGVGGLGSRATGTLAVTPGQVLTIFVGGQGGVPTSGFNGGGTGGNANSGGGGGGSDVRFPGATSADRILVAGGGGGGGRAGCEPNTVNGGAGGNGDGNGANGVTSPNGGGGFGAIGTTPGAAGIGCAGFLGSPGLGGFGPSGGNGGAGQSCCCFTFASVPGGGGGGGGFLGGAGGGGGSAGTTGCLGNDKGGGGGGAGGTSSTGGVTAGVITTGIQTGNGQVVLNYNVTVVCTGPTTAFTITVNPTATVNPVANQQVCEGSPTTAVNFTSPTPGVIFNWTNNTPAIGLAAAGTGNIASFIAQNGTPAPLVATITVTPLVPVGGSIPGGPVTFTNAANIAIPASGTGSGTGSASNPYPSNITVSGIPTTGVIVESIRLTNIQHTWSDDIGVLLVGPGGQKFVPMARVGGSGGFDATATITIKDGSPAMSTVTAPIPTGTYGPTARTSAIWPAPAPGTPYSYAAPFGTSTFANTFNNTSNYNGTWGLYVTDMAGGDIGNIAGGWSITVVTPTAPAVGCFGTPSTFTITVNPNPAIVILADPGTTICEGDPTLLTVVTGSATTLGLLYNQTGAQINGSPSQVFEPANTAFNSQSADDFTVPAGATWGITQFTFNGIGAGNPTSVNLFIYNNSGSNLPGAVVATYNNLTSYVKVGANYTVTLPAALNLSAGTYWVSFQVNMSFAAGGQWFWANFGNTNIGNQYAWQNPGGGFGTPCAAWGYGATGCNVGGGVARNNIFSVTGTSIIGGAPLPGGYTFLWSPALGLSSTTSNPVAASPMNTTTYTVVATGPGPAFCSRTASVLITVNKRPVVTAQPANTVRCVGTTATFTVGATGTGLTYQWQESLTGCSGTPTWTNLTNTAPYSGVNLATLSITGVTQLLSGRGYRCIVSGTCTPFIPPTNVSNCATLTVNPNPVVSITPAGPVCGGVAGISGTQLSSATTPPPVPGSVTANSGTISLPVPDNNPAGVNTSLTVAGIPANATITGVRANWNMTHTWNGDMVFVLRSPNGSILNLDYFLTATGGAGATTGFVNTTVSSAGSAALSSGTGTYTGTFAADARTVAQAPFGAPGPTGFAPTVSTWTPMYTPIPNGSWTLAMYDGGAIDLGTLTNWSVTVDYTTPGTTGSTLSYVWAPVGGLYTNNTATLPYTGQNLGTVYAAPTALTTYTVTATDVVTGCFSTASVLVNYTPPAPTVTPSSVTMCLGDPAVRLVSSSATTTSVQFCSGPISVVVPDANAGGATSNLTVSGIPAGCNVSAMSVNFNMSHTWAGDVAIALRAPNGNILNLDYYLSNTGGTGATAGFTNTTISSAGTAALSSVGSPYTGTFRADAITTPTPPVNGPTGPTGNLANVNTWNALYSVPNGTWTLAMVDAFAGDQGTLTSWCINMTYVCGVPSTAATWSPIGGLFNDAAATIPYLGTPRDTVWTRPTPAGVYPYQVTVQSVPAFLPVPPAFTNPASITINAAGAGTPYPANLVVSGLPTTGVSVQSVTLTGMNHTWANDIDILLQSPNLTNVILMSDIGGNVPIPAGATYTFSDAGPAMAGAPNASGTYRPTNLVGALGVEPDNWPAPGPLAVAQAAPALSMFGSTADMNGTWKLFVVDDAAGDAGSISGGYTIRFNVPVAPCTSPARTVVVTVNQPTVINANIPVNQTICTDKVATFSAAVVSGTGPHSYQWQVSTNGGGTFANVANGGVYSGATTATLTITAPPVSMSNYQYRCIVTGAAPCAAQTSRVATLVVNPLPVIVISATAPRSLFPGLRSTFTSTVTPNPAATYSWIRNGVVLSNPASGVVSGLGTGSIVVDVDGQGDYQLRVTDVNGCTNISNTVTIKDSVNGKCFIYPNPTSGKFQVRYYSVANNVLPRTLTISDAKGDRVLTQRYIIGFPYERMEVDMRGFGKGMYWAEIGDLNGNRLAVCRIVVQ